MIRKLKALLRDERGITGLETAIILIAFVVVAAVFAFTVLSAGVFTSEKGKEAVYAGLEQVRGSLELRGSVIALGSGTVVTEVRVPVANSASGAAIDLKTGVDRKIVIDYRDEDQRVSDIDTWSVDFKGGDDGDDMLEQGEQAEITVPISGVVTTDLGINKTFAIEIKPLHGGTLVIERTTPGVIDPVMDLH
jgi:flagellin FlaB